MRSIQRELIALAPVIGLGAWLRLGYVGVNSFAFDEARLSLIALRMARGGEFASVGMPSSAGVPNMPAAAWLFAIPYAFTADPYGATLTVSLLSLLSVIGVWWLGRQLSPLAGWTAALYLAAHPFAILYGRSIWAQNLLIPLGMIWLIAAWQGVNNKKWGIALVAFLSGFALQIHFAGAALAIAGVAVGLMGRWWKTPIPVFIGGTLALMTALPFALTPGALTSLLDTAGGAAQIDLSALRQTVQLLGGTNWRYLLHGELELPLMRTTPTIVRGGLVSLGVVALSTAGLLYLATKLNLEFPERRGTTPNADVKTPDDSVIGDFVVQNAPPALTILILSILLLFSPILLFIRHSTPVLLHYLLVSLPAGAIGIAWLSVHVRIGRLYPVLAMVIMLALIWTGQLIRAFPLAGTIQTPNGLATPLGTLHRVAHTIADPVMFFTHGDDPNVEGEAAIFSALWWGRDPRIIDGRNVLILPPYRASILFTERPFQAWEEMRASELFVDRRELPRREGVEPFQLTTYDGETPPTGFTMLAQPVTFAHGGTLRGWRTYTIGGRTRISTLWSASTALSEAVQQFHHLYPANDPNGDPLQIADVSVRGHLWRDGDTVIVMGDFIDLDPRIAYTVAVGHYTLPDIVRIAVDEPTDKYPTNRVLLGTFQAEG